MHLVHNACLFHLDALWFVLGVCFILHIMFKFTKDQKQPIQEGVISSPIVPCCRAENECQGLYVPRLYHSALSKNAAVLECWLCGVESTAFLSCPRHTFGILVTCGWIWAGSLLLRPRDVLSSLDQHNKASNISKRLLALFLPSPRPVEACLCICLFLFVCFCEGWSVRVNVCVCLCWLYSCVGTHLSVALPQTSGASPLTRADQSPDLTVHNATQNVHCFLSPDNVFIWLFYSIKASDFSVGSSLLAGSKLIFSDIQRYI